MEDDSQHSDQQSFQSSLSNSYHNKHHHKQQIQSNLISAQENSHKRQVDHLYQNICEKNLQPKAWLQRAKSDKNMVIHDRNEMSAVQKSAKFKQLSQKNNKSYQEQIALSNYKQLLKNHFQSQRQKDQDLHLLQKRYREQQQQNSQIRQQNRKLKKEMLKLIKQRYDQEEKVKDLDSSLKKLSRRYENLLKESEAKQNSLKIQMKRLREEKSNYESLITALKESIHILKGKKVKDLQQIWLEWKQIFELASLQQCKVSKKGLKH